MTTTTMLAERVEATGSMLCVGLDYGPHTTGLLLGEDDSPTALNTRLIDYTHPHAAAYKFQLAGYLALGTQGISALRESVLYLRDTHPAIPIILDAKFSDIAVSLENYARFAFEYLGVDAVTANPLLGRDANAPLLDYPDKLIYFLCSTTNPGSAEFQEWGAPLPLFERVAQRVAAWNEETSTCGLVVGATHPSRVRRIRQAAPDLPFLVPGIGAQGGVAAEVLAGALTDQPGDVLVNVSRSIMFAEDPQQAAEHFAGMLGEASAEPFEPETFPERVVATLAELGSIRRGEFTLASGETSDVYVDLRLLSGHPEVLRWIAYQMGEGLYDVPADIIAAVPTAGIPLGTALALHVGRPLYYVRDEAKAHGTGRQIEGGQIEAGQRVLLVDDVISTGGSKVGAIEALREAGAVVDDIAVVLDRRDDPAETFMGAQVHSLITLADIRE